MATIDPQEIADTLVIADTYRRDAARDPSVDPAQMAIASYLKIIAEILVTQQRWLDRYVGWKDRDEPA